MNDGQILTFVGNHRTRRRAGLLPLWKVRRLEQIPGWEWNPHAYHRTAEQWVPVAEELASKHGGVLPGQFWLQRNRYIGLAGARNLRPELFAHIPQQTFRRAIREWVAVAERLAADNNGILPETPWMTDNGYGTLREYLYKHPDLFAHIPKPEGRFKTLEQHLVDAEELYRVHDGLLPNRQWLRDNGYGALDQYMHYHPESFSHFKRKRLLRRLEEWVAIAEEVARKNGGFLPPVGYQENSMRHIIYMHQSSFAHIPQSVMDNKKRLVAFRNGSPEQRAALEIRHGLRETPPVAEAA